jgi:hypothetical protein
VSEGRFVQHLHHAPRPLSCGYPQLLTLNGAGAGRLVRDERPDGPAGSGSWVVGAVRVHAVGGVGCCVCLVSSRVGVRAAFRCRPDDGGHLPVDRLAFLFGVALSLCANIASAPELTVFAVAVAACPPLALLPAVELLNRALKRHRGETAHSETGADGPETGNESTTETAVAAETAKRRAVETGNETS